MSEETTTEPVDQTPAAEQPEADVQSIPEDAPLPQGDPIEEAEPTQTETQTEQPTVDQETIEWAKKAGVDLNDPVKLAKMVRDSQQDVHKTRKLNSELQSKLAASAPPPDTGNELVNDIVTKQNQMETKNNVNEFFMNNPEARELDQAMTEYFEEILDSNPALAEGLRNDLPTLYQLTKARQSNTETSTAIEDARREERETIARQSRAQIPTAAASSPTASDGLTLDNIDEKVANMSAEEYKRRLPEINKLLA